MVFMARKSLLHIKPPTGVTAFREIGYDGMKNSLGAINIPTQVPLKGAAIFFVNGGTGYSLLYLDCLL